MVTDGARWRMFDAFEREGMFLQPVMEFDLMTTDSAEAARIAERMSYEKIESERWSRAAISV